MFLLLQKVFENYNFKLVVWCFSKFNKFLSMPSSRVIMKQVPIWPGQDKYTSFLHTAKNNMFSNKEIFVHELDCGFVAMETGLKTTIDTRLCRKFFFIWMFCVPSCCSMLSCSRLFYYLSGAFQSLANSLTTRAAAPGSAPARIRPRHTSTPRAAPPSTPCRGDR